MTPRDTNTITYQLIENKISTLNNTNLTYSEIVMMTTNYDKALDELKNNPQLHIKQYENKTKLTRKKHAR